MRKRLIDGAPQEVPEPGRDWLNVEELAEVELTSEDAAHPVEAALLATGSPGWRAAVPGSQTIRLLFASPQNIRRIYLSFQEPAVERTQEYVLRWSPDKGRSFQEIVRQQWNFSPSGATSETESYEVELSDVTILELNINPDIGNSKAVASLEQWRIA